MYFIFVIAVIVTLLFSRFVIYIPPLTMLHRYRKTANNKQVMNKNLHIIGCILYVNIEE
jgi:hypothetical protein